MRILIVGAGATGTVFAAALLKGGAEVGFYVREHHRTRLQQGLTLYHQGFFTLREERISQIAVATTPAEVAASHWDEVWFTTPSDALRGPWLNEFLAATGRATLVVLQPDPEDSQYLREHGAKDRLIVQGLIQFSAWQSPLPHEPASQNGITCLLPPGVAAQFDAECAASATIAATLTRGGLRAAVRNDLPAHAARMSALTIPLIAGLELVDWRIERYAHHEVLKIAVAAAHEAISGQCARFAVRKPISFKLLLNRQAIALLLRLAPWVPGFDAEAFLRHHFSKVDRQTRQMLGTYIRHAAQNGLPHTALEQLLGALPPATH